MNEAFSRHHRMMSQAFSDPGSQHRALDGGVTGHGQHRALDGARGGATGHGGHYHSSSTVMHFSNSGNGAPTFYHASSSETSGPGGVSGHHNGKTLIRKT